MTHHSQLPRPLNCTRSIAHIPVLSVGLLISRCPALRKFVQDETSHSGTKENPQGSVQHKTLGFCSSGKAGTLKKRTLLEAPNLS